MSNTDFDPVEVGPPIDFGTIRAQAQVATSIDAEPDKAARANTISRAIGVPPAAVYENLEQYEGQYKDTLSAGIVRGNSNLQAYINSHPLAAKVSNDDYGQLDAVSQAVGKMGPGQSILQAGIKGFVETAKLGELSEEHEKLANLLASNPVFGNLFIRQAALAGTAAFTGTMQVATGLFGGIAGGIGEAYHQLGGGEAEAARLTRDLIIFAQVGLSGQAGLHGVVAPEIHAAISEAAKVAKAVEPYVASGKEPPVGVHPIIDEFKKDQAKTDADNLAEALKESVASVTRERDPDLFTAYIAQHTDASIGINADAVRALYGEKPPVPGEGPLGFIPDLAAQLERAEATGGDINVSVADWLGKVEPDVAKELKDHIRARPEGVTIEEGKALTPPEMAPTQPIDSVRQASGLQGQVAERKLELRREGEPQVRGEETRHHLILNGEDGNPLAHINLTEEMGGKRLYVDDVNVDQPYGKTELANTVGPRAMREALYQIKEMFPNAESIEGMRVSGARGKAEAEAGVERAGEDLHAGIDLTKLKPRAKAPEPEAPGLLQRAKDAVLGKSEEAKAAEAKVIEERELFDKASAIGMTVDQYKRYAKLIERRAAEDAEAASERALTDQRKRQTAEWKSNRAELRPQVREEVLARPEVELDEMLREGRVKLAKDGLTPDQVALLPKDYISADGIHPQDLAGLFGDSHAGALVDRLIALTQAREQAGMKPKQHLERMVDAETDRQMEVKYGSLDRNILEEAKDQVLSETQESLLHEEVLARAEEAGLQLTLTKEELKAAIKDFFDRQLVRDVSSDRGLAEAGRAGRAAEMALLKGDYAEAFRQKQRQFNAFTMATFAKKFEKVQAQFAKAAKRFSAREVAGVEQEYTNWVHDILGRVESPVKRSVQDLVDAIGRTEHKTLADFVEHKQTHDMREVPVADFLMDPQFAKRVDDLTTAEFAAVNDSIKALAKNGRDEMKIIKAGEEHDLDVVKKQMIEQLAAFKEKHYDASGGRWLGPLPPAVAKPLRTYLVSHLQLESVFNRWDKGDPNGVFTQFVARELATAANSEAALERQFSVRLREVADKVDLKEWIDNPIFKDPLGGEAIPMTRKNLRAILLNVGNDSNFTKLAKGYLGSISKGEAGKLEVEGFKEQIIGWLHQHATKEDWDWAQKIGDIFADIKKQSDVMYRSLTGGVEPESIPVRPIDTPHGQYAGWYYPVVYHPVWEGASKKLMGGDPLEQVNYNRATTPAGYTKSRTGYAAPLALDLDMMPVRMRQMLHDIAFRPSVIQAGKIFYDKDVRAAITKHYGAEYTKSLVPYLRDVANAANYRNDAQQVFTRFSEVIRQNIIATLIGLNPGTVLKHGPTAAMNSITEVGAGNFLRAAKGLFSINDATGESNWAFAMKTSEELSRRHRFYRETLGGAQQEVMGTPSLRDQIVSLGSMPVAMSDLLSAVPTWMAKYESAMKEHGVHGDAVFEADRAVRRAHGSSVITNRPQVMRTGAMGSWLASLYGFFNHIMNRQYELAWKAGDTLGLVKEGKYADAMKEVPAITGMLFSYVIFPAIVEELVTPLATEKGDSWGKTAAKSLAYSISASWIGVRDIVSAAVNGRDPSIGLLTTAYKTMTDTIRDLNKPRPFSKHNAGALLQHSVTTLGAATGLANAQIGKAGRFGFDVANGQEKPKGPWGWMVGLRYGTLKNHSRTFEEWRKGH